jgi:hypothetical protein
MSTLRENVTDYLAARRAMGFKVEGLSKLLLSFVAFCEARGAARVQEDLAVEWATAMIKVPVSAALVARRMDAVRIFARYQRALDPATQIPPEAICNRRYRAQEPNVFGEDEVCALLAAADTLSPPFKAVTWRTLIGLLAATGMRPGEACRLTLDDIDLSNGVVPGPADEVQQVQAGVHPPDHHEGAGPLPASSPGLGRDHGSSLSGRLRQQSARGDQPRQAGRHLQADPRRCRHHHRAGAQAAQAP